MRVIANNASSLQGEALEFERQEDERRAERQARSASAADLRARASEIDSYYQLQVQALQQTLIVPGSRVLDVGCGFGDLWAALPTSEAIGIDACARMVELGRERHPELDLRALDVERDPLPEGPTTTVRCASS